MSWWQAVPAMLATLAWVALPGLAVSYLLGLRGVAAWALAPITSIAAIASAAVAAEQLNLDWSVLVALVACAGTVVVAGAVALPLRRRPWFAADPDQRGLGLAALLGWVPGLVLGAITIGQAVPRPDALSQTYDALFHYNALAYVEDTHQASSLTLGTLGNPEVPATFYPAAWHDLASLVMMSAGADIPTAANLVTFVGALVVWPMACLLLVRQLFGRNRAALAITGTLSLGFTAFPWDLLGFGVLWPNLLGLAFAPAALALVFTVTRWVRSDAIGVGRAWLMLPVAVVAAGFAHPNVLFSVAVLALFPVGARVFVRGWEWHRGGRTWRGLSEVVGFVVLVGAGWYWAATTPTFAATREHYWPPFETPANAFGEVVLNATNSNEALWVLSAVVVVGMFAARRYPPLRLVVAGHLATTFLYVLTAAINRPDTRKFTGYWYNDSHRLAAMLPITAVPLVVGGVLLLTAKIAAATAERSVRWRRVAAVSPVVTAVVLTAALVALTGGLYPDDRRGRVTIGYAPPDPALLVTPEMRAFYARIDDKLPEDALVAGNPFNGSAMLWALADREVLFPHFRGTHSPEQSYLAAHLDDAATDPAVCAAATELGVDYLLVGDASFRPTDGQWNYYDGVNDPWAGPGFELVDSLGDNKLYRLTACPAPPEKND